MASRDRLKQGRFYTELRQSLIDLLSNDTHLKQKEQEYKGRVFRETGKDKDMVQSLFSKLKGNQDIRKMFSGNNGAFSFFTKKVKKPVPSEEQKEENKKETKKLKRYPTLLKIKGFERSSEDFVKVIRKAVKEKLPLKPMWKIHFFRVQMMLVLLKLQRWILGKIEEQAEKRIFQVKILQNYACNFPGPVRENLK
jgi:hypothetical protein